MARSGNKQSDTHGCKAWYWDHFEDSSKKYKSNKTHNEARCKRCIGERVKEIRREQGEQQAAGVLSAEQLLSGERLRKQGKWFLISCWSVEVWLIDATAETDTTPICGKTETLKRHIRDCEHVSQSAKTKLELENFDKDRDDDDVILPEIQPAGTQSSGSASKQSTFTVTKSKPFKKSQQNEFDADLCKVFVACNWAWLHADNPVFRWFFDKYLPSAHIPDRKTLSGAILNAESQRINDEMKKSLNQQYCTGVVDGWSNSSEAIQCTGLNCQGEVRVYINLWVVSKQ